MAVSVTQLHPMFVGDVTGLDLSDPAADTQYPALQAALDQHAALIFHGPALTQERQVAFCGMFGPLEGEGKSVGILKTDIKRRVDVRLADISNLDEEGKVLGQQDRRRMFALGNQLWHVDSSFKAIPAKYSMLHAHSVTPEGGETQIADTRAAYEALPQKMKDRVEDLVAVHSIFCSRQKLGFTDFTDEERAALPPVKRPLVRFHKESGRKALYLASHAEYILGMEVPDGKMLLRDLIEHCTQPQFVHTHTWAIGDLIIWDNRCTLHRGRPYDEALYRRDMRRATIEDHENYEADLAVA
ncbi:MAG: TauD/TfdA family dioxygenase [Pseudomonadota bacterium]